MEQAEYTAATTEVVPVLSTSSMTNPVQNSAALKRLLDEVRFDTVQDVSAATAYNRQHNRHNR